eukprot:3172166-Alexandrium_andersonii.AAC.1
MPRRCSRTAGSGPRSCPLRWPSRGNPRAPGPPRRSGATTDRGCATPRCAPSPAHSAPRAPEPPTRLSAPAG